MQTALFLTDCSVDSALSLRRWLSEHNAPLRVTIVHPYDLEPGCLLTKETSRLATQQATDRLRHWSAMVPQPQNGTLKTEIMLGPGSLVFNLHVRLRWYDYALLTAIQDELANILTDGHSPLGTQLICLDQPWGDLSALTGTTSRNRQAVIGN